LDELNVHIKNLEDEIDQFMKPEEKAASQVIQGIPQNGRNIECRRPQRVYGTFYFPPLILKKYCFARLFTKQYLRNLLFIEQRVCIANSGACGGRIATSTLYAAVRIPRRVFILWEIRSNFP